MEPKQRVLSLDPAGLLWGSERALLDFIGGIPGFESACCCPPNSPLIAQLKVRNVGCFPSFQANLHLRGTGARVLALGGLLRALWAYRPGVLHVNQAGATRIALLACRIFGIPCVAHVRLQEDVEYLNRLRPKPKYLKQLVAISQPIADLIKTQPNLKAIPCAMLLDAYCPKSETGGDAVLTSREPAKWDFLCVGRICDPKGQEILIRAMQILRQGGNSPKVVFVGEINDYGRKLQNLVKELALEATVEFAGHRDDVFGIMDAAKWLVCPSYFESLGRVLFEAWDAGIPVVVGKFSGGAAASVNASGGGLLFGEWTPISLAATLGKALATDSSEAEQMTKKGRVWMAQATNPIRYVESMSGILRNAIHSFKSKA